MRSLVRLCTLSSDAFCAVANCGADTNASQFYFTFSPTPWLDGKHTVFGTVVAGLDVLTRLEAVGSRSGTTSKRVAIDACGVLVDPRAAELAGAREEAPKAQPAEGRPVEDADAASARRLRETLQGGAAVPIASLAAVAPPAAAAARPERSADGASAPAHHSSEAAEAQQSGDALAGMDARQRRLFELRLKLNESRKANHSAVVAEKRHRDAPQEERSESRKRSAEGSSVALEGRLKAHGIADPSKAYLLQSMDEASARYEREERKPAAFGWDVFNQKSVYAAYKKHAGALAMDEASYAAAAAADPEFYRDASSLAYGTAPELAPGAVDRMVAELGERAKARDAFSRRRKHYEGGADDGINDRNAFFNKKLERELGKYTTEIKANLERGSALPEH